MDLWQAYAENEIIIAKITNLSCFLLLFLLSFFFPIQVFLFCTYLSPTLPFLLAFVLGKLSSTSYIVRFLVTARRKNQIMLDAQNHTVGLFTAVLNRSERLSAGQVNRRCSTKTTFQARVLCPGRSYVAGAKTLVAAGHV